MKKYMMKCIRLAKKGLNKTSPNPMVGCVVLNKNGDIISEGYHKKYGENHAERDALLKLSNNEAEGGTLIVNLEPCNHYGKTPPCTDLIIKNKLSKVIIGSLDTNPNAKGGIEKLRQNGIEVEVGVLEDKCLELNEVFYTNINKNRLFVALKTATTIDGKIATSLGDSKWITNYKSRKYSKKLRSFYDAILTSSSTVIADNPEMEHKTKIIIDRFYKTNFGYKIFKQGKCILVTTKNVADVPENVTVLKYTSIKNLLLELYEMGICSIFVEAGGTLSGEFIKENIVDKIYHFIAPKILNDNSAISSYNADKILNISEAKQYKIQNIKKLDSDILLTLVLQQS